MSILTVVRTWQNNRDRMATTWKLRNSPLALPGQTRPASLSEWTTEMDTQTRVLMRQIDPDSEMTPLDWEAFLELVPNMRKLLGLNGEGGLL